MYKSLITGIGGQDASFLAEQLLEKGHEVHGVTRRCSTDNLERVSHVVDRLHLHEGDITDCIFMTQLLTDGFDFVYNLAAQSHVGTSFKNPVYTFEVDALAPIQMLHILEEHAPETRFYQASTSEMFSGKQQIQDDMTTFCPQSPYGNAKLAAHTAVRQARDRGLFACAGILFNHESERRGVNFVTRKITTTIAKIKHGLATEIVLGDLTPQRDWGFAGDYTKAMQLMIEADTPDDFIIGTGETHTVKEFLDIAWQKAGFELSELPKHLRQDERFMRPNEVKRLCADPFKARELLGWRTEVSFQQLAERMMEHDLKLFE